MVMTNDVDRVLSLWGGGQKKEFSYREKEGWMVWRACTVVVTDIEKRE